MTLIRDAYDRKLLERRMNELFAESARLQERAELLGRGGQAHAREAAAANLEARAAEAEAQALFWALDMLKVTEKRLAETERAREREIRALQRDFGRERKDLTSRLLAAEGRAQAMADALHDAEGGTRELDRMVAEAGERLAPGAADRESAAVLAALFDEAEEGMVSVSLEDLRRMTRIAEPRIRRTLVRLAAAEVIEAAGPAPGGDRRPRFRLMTHARETRRTG